MEWKLKILILLMPFLLSHAVNSFANDDWELASEGAGTPFEVRWAGTSPIEDKSSAGTMSAYTQINANQGELSLFIANPYPLIDSLISAYAGDELNCTYDNWRLAIDRKEFKIEMTSNSTDNNATSLHPKNTKVFWEAFSRGKLMAVRLDRACDNDMNKLTIVYSLSGSKAALDYVKFKEPVVSKKPKQSESTTTQDELNTVEESKAINTDATTQILIQPEKQNLSNQLDLSGLDRQTRTSIEMACSGEKLDGPAPHRKCIEMQLQSIEGMNEAPDLSGLDRQTRTSIEMACSGEKLDGPAPHRKCIEMQLQSIDM
jgi:hypothetical protein